MVLFLTKYHFGQLALNLAGLLFAFPLYPDFLPNPPENQNWLILKSRIQNLKPKIWTRHCLNTARLISLLQTSFYSHPTSSCFLVTNCFCLPPFSSRLRSYFALDLITPSVAEVFQGSPFSSFSSRLRTYFALDLITPSVALICTSMALARKRQISFNFNSTGYNSILSVQQLDLQNQAIQVHLNLATASQLSHKDKIPWKRKREMLCTKNQSMLSKSS